MRYVHLITLAVLITFAAPAARALDDAPVLRLYDVRDLAADDEAMAALVAGIKSAIGPGIESDVAARGRGTIVVRATADALARVDLFLGARRRAVHTMISIQLRVIRGPRSVFPGGDERGTRILFDKARIARLMEAIRSSKDVAVQAAPKILCFAGQKANISIVRQIAYVKDFEIVRNDKGDTVADPVIGTISEGIVIDLRPFVDGATGSVKIDLETLVSQLQRPIPTVEVRISGMSKPMTIQVPTVSKATLKASSILPKGKALYLSIGTLKSADGKSLEHVGVILDVEVVELK